jgi:hypothetical protein
LKALDLKGVQRKSREEGWISFSDLTEMKSFDEGKILGFHFFTRIATALAV